MPKKLRDPVPCQIDLNKLRLVSIDDILDTLGRALRICREERTEYMYSYMTRLLKGSSLPLPLGERDALLADPQFLVAEAEDLFNERASYGNEELTDVRPYNCFLTCLAIGKGR